MKKSLTTVCTALFTIALFSQCTNDQNQQSQADSISNQQTVIPEEKPIGPVITTDKFEVKAYGIDTLHAIYTIDKKLIVAANKDEKFVTLDVDFKNISGAKQNIGDGELTINQDGKNHKYNYLTIVLGDGYSSSLETFSPGFNKRSKIIYKIPRNVSGAATWRPDSTSTAIDIGEVK